MQATWKILCGALALCGLAAPAAAHSTSISYLELSAPSADGPVALRWDLALHDLVWNVHIDHDFDGVVTPQEVNDSRTRYLEPAVLGQITLERGGEGCRLAVDDVAFTERAGEKHLSVMLAADCPRAGLLSVSGPLFLSGGAAQRVLLSLARGEERLAGAIGADAASWSEPARRSAWQSFAHFVVEGIWHVLIGYDHIAFVLLLLLPSVLRSNQGRWQAATSPGEVARDMITIVTAFTVAHSTTLALAVTGKVSLPPQPVEIAIAASIAVAAVINLLPRLSRLRLPLAFGFGLVHGFGFANVLGELDPAGSGLLPLLAGFNIGVEIAQLGIVALVLPLIYLARDTRWYASGVMPLGSCALGAAGLVWLLQRL